MLIDRLAILCEILKLVFILINTILIVQVIKKKKKIDERQKRAFICSNNYIKLRI